MNQWLVVDNIGTTNGQIVLKTDSYEKAKKFVEDALRGSWPVNLHVAEVRLAVSRRIFSAEEVG